MSVRDLRAEGTPQGYRLFPRALSTLGNGMPDIGLKPHAVVAPRFQREELPPTSLLKWYGFISIDTRYSRRLGHSE